jgi:hypothetical protein
MTEGKYSKSLLTTSVAYSPWMSFLFATPPWEIDGSGAAVVPLASEAPTDGDR